MNHQQFSQVFLPKLRQADRVLLTMTIGPDGDSLGSMMGMAHALKHFGKAYVCYSPDPIPPMFRYLLEQQPVMRELEDTVHDYAMVIIFDAGDIKRSPLAKDFIARDPKKTTVVNIDHHPTVTDFKGQPAVDINFIDINASATTEMVYKILNELGVPLHQHSANSLLTGILTDTGHFSNHSTTSESLSIAAALMAKGADHRTITDATMRNKSIGTLQLWGRALSRLHKNSQTGIVSTAITLKDLEECNVPADATTGIANFLNSLGEGKVAMVIQEMPGGKIKASLRTTSEVNVADIAARFGGGGHTKAAGFVMPGRLVHDAAGWSVEPPLPTGQGGADLVH